MLQTVQYHVVPGQVILFKQFTDGQTLSTLAGESLTVRTSESASNCSLTAGQAVPPIGCTALSLRMARNSVSVCKQAQCTVATYGLARKVSY